MIKELRTKLPLCGVGGVGGWGGQSGLLSLTERMPDRAGNRHMVSK